MSQATGRYQVFCVKVIQHLAGSEPIVSNGWAVYDTHQSPPQLKSDVFSQHQ